MIILLQNSNNCERQRSVNDNVLSKDRVKLFRDVMFFVAYDVLSDADHNVRIRFPVDVSRV